MVKITLLEKFNLIFVIRKTTLTNGKYVLICCDMDHGNDGYQPFAARRA